MKIREIFRKYRRGPQMAKEQIRLLFRFIQSRRGVNSIPNLDLELSSARHEHCRGPETPNSTFIFHQENRAQRGKNKLGKNHNAG